MSDPAYLIWFSLTIALGPHADTTPKADVRVYQCEAFEDDNPTAYISTFPPAGEIDPVNARGDGWACWRGWRVKL